MNFVASLKRDLCFYVVLLTVYLSLIFSEPKKFKALQNSEEKHCSTFMLVNLGHYGFTTILASYQLWKVESLNQVNGYAKINACSLLVILVWAFMGIDYCWNDGMRILVARDSFTYQKLYNISISMIWMRIYVLILCAIGCWCMLCAICCYFAFVGAEQRQANQ